MRVESVEILGFELSRNNLLLGIGLLLILFWVLSKIPWSSWLGQLLDKALGGIRDESSRGRRFRSEDPEILSEEGLRKVGADRLDALLDSIEELHSAQRWTNAFQDRLIRQLENLKNLLSRAETKLRSDPDKSQDKRL